MRSESEIELKQMSNFLKSQLEGAGHSDSAIATRLKLFEGQYKSVKWMERNHNILDVPLLNFSQKKTMTIRDTMEGTLFIGSQGSGKTSSANTLFRAMLKNGYAGLVLSVKEDVVKEWIDLAKQSGRAHDIILFGNQHSHCFNPFEGATSSEVIELFSELSSSLRSQDGSRSTNDQFWETQLDVCLRNLVTLCKVNEDLSVSSLGQMFASRANDEKQKEYIVWQRKSILFRSIEKGLTIPELSEEVKLAEEYFLTNWFSLGQDFKGSIVGMVQGVIDRLRRPPLSNLFCKKNNMSLWPAFDGGKIIICTNNTLGSSLNGIDKTDGLITNLILQHCFTNLITKKKNRYWPAFLVADECQETLTSSIVKKLSILRSYRLACVFLTQNLSAMDARIGQDSRIALTGLMGTKIL